MPVSFTELVIEGQFVLVKGFLMGFLFGSEKPFRYFFHRKYGIRRETFREFIKEIFELDNVTHLCIEDKMVAKFISAVEQSHDKIGLEVKSIRNIEKAKLDFSYEVFNEKLAAEIKQAFEDLPDQVELIEPRFNEEHAKDAVGLEGYAPVHDFVSSGKGQLSGDFGGIMEVYLRIKRAEWADSVRTGEIKLNLVDREKELMN